MKNIDIRALRHEAEYYGITPLVKRLMLCEDLSQSSCGDVLFYGYLPPPSEYFLIFLFIYYWYSIFYFTIKFIIADVPLQEPASVSASISDVSIHGRPAGAPQVPRTEAATSTTAAAPQSSGSSSNSSNQPSNSNS